MDPDPVAEDDRAVVLSLPFRGPWLVRNSPARRVPSHGADLFGERYAIDFIGVDERRRTAGRFDGRTIFGTEPPERFVAFGRLILAPATGVVVQTHDGEPDHRARRSPLALVPYALTQAARVREGVRAIAGNHVVIQVAERRFVALVHLKAASVRVAAGDLVEVGQEIAACGNSGNSTQPHVHLQVMDSADLAVARGVPAEFRRFREHPRRGRARVRERGIPSEGAVVEPLG
jgi:hypothetical protein